VERCYQVICVVGGYDLLSYSIWNVMGGSFKDVTNLIKWT